MKHRLGIALSGGGLRGIAHIGVLEALREAGVQADCFAGTSAGALVGAMAAAGHSTETMLEFFEERNPFRLSKLALGRPGLFDTEKIVPDFVPLFPDDRFEALDKPLFVAATDLIRARPEIFASGPLVRPLVASSSVPLIFTPTTVAGRPYADGGLTNNFPVEPLEVLCDVVVGVYASPLRDIEPEALDSTLAVSHRAFDLGMFLSSRSKFHRCEVLVCPRELAEVPTFGKADVQRVFEIGLEAGRKQSGEVLQALERMTDPREPAEDG